MSHDELLKMMKEMGIPFAHNHFVEGEAPEPTFLVFLYPKADNFSADGIAYFKINQLDIELYNDLKNPDLEETIEAVLLKYVILRGKTETHGELETQSERDEIKRSFG